MSRKPKIGNAWIVYSEDPASGHKQLLSILDSRKSRSAVSAYVEQLYVDKFGSFDERVAYKKRKKSWPYLAEKIGLTNAICCGSNILYWAHQCTDLRLDGGFLIGQYKYVKSVDRHLTIIEYTEGEVRLKAT